MDFSLENILKLKQQNSCKMDYIVKFHYEKVQNHIKDAYKNYLEFCYYTISDIEVKLPLYNSYEVAKLLVDFMISKGWEAKVIYQNKIYIRWTPKERPQRHIPVLLKIVQFRIKDAAQENQDQIFYEIPSFINDLPWYNPKDAAQEIGINLSNQGFIIKIYESVLYISWKKETLEYKSKIKIKFQSDEERRKEALEKINYINEQRYIDFANPKRI